MSNARKFGQVPDNKADGEITNSSSLPNLPDVSPDISKRMSGISISSSSGESPSMFRAVNGHPKPTIPNLILGSPKGSPKNKSKNKSSTTQIKEEFDGFSHSDGSASSTRANNSPKNSPKFDSPRGIINLAKRKLSLSSSQLPGYSPKDDSFIIEGADPTICVGELPFSQNQVDLVIQYARDEFQKQTNEAKNDEAVIDNNKKFGISLKITIKTETKIETKAEAETKIKTETLKKIVWVIVSGNYHSSSQFYLFDQEKKAGAGGSAATYKVYDLQTGDKVAGRALLKDASLAEDDPLAISFEEDIVPEIKQLEIIGHFFGVFKGDVGLRHPVYIIFTKFVPGKTLIASTYKLSEEVKCMDPDYLANPKYYEARIHSPYIEALDDVVAMAKELMEYHDKCVTHNDLSAFNIHLDKNKGKTVAGLVDFEKQIDMGCDVFSSEVVPTKDNLLQLPFVSPFESNAAYIRVGDKELYYVNKRVNKAIVRLCVLVNLPSTVDLRNFDRDFKVSTKSRRLTRDEIENIIKLTGHSHKLPLVKATSDTYSYLAPELYKDKPDMLSYETDLYALGVLLVKRLADENIEKECIITGAADKARNDGRTVPLTPARFMRMAPSIFGKCGVQQPINAYNPTKETLDEFVDRYIFKRMILPEMLKVVKNLLSEDPKERLKGFSNLNELYTRLCGLRTEHVRLSKNLKIILSSSNSTPEIAAAVMRIIYVLAVMQGMGISLKKLVPVMQEESIAAIDRVVKLLNDKELETSSQSPKLARQASSDASQSSVDFSATLQSKRKSAKEALKAESQRIEKLAQKQKIMFDALNSLTIGWKQMKDNAASFALLEMLVKCRMLFGKNAEIVDFIKQLAPTTNKEDSKNSFRH